MNAISVDRSKRRVAGQAVVCNRRTDVRVRGWTAGNHNPTHGKFAYRVPCFSRAQAIDLHALPDAVHLIVGEHSIAAPCRADAIEADICDLIPSNR